MSARRSGVSTYLGKRAFYAQDMARKHRAGQYTELPPRCGVDRCRLPGTIADGAGGFRCGDHYEGVE